MNKAGRLKFTGRVLGDLYGSCAVEIPKDKCTGCGACCQVCGRKAITMVTDQEGFWHPSIDFEKCNHCGRCAGVCPVKGLKPEERNEVRAVYAAWSLNEETRRESTSGGVFSELADEMLKNGAYVYGAAYNDDFMPEHRGIHSREEISKLRQSKYVQSDIRDCFSEIAELLRIGSRVFFCGTPCQCEALTRFLEVQKVQQDSLVLADFICRGVNSPKVYKIYLEELKKKYQSEISRVWFKNKTFGWNNFSTKVEFQNGDSFIQQRCDDEFMRGYLEQNLYLRPSCMNCDFKGSERCSDITLADFWGVNLEGRQKETDKGTSLIIIHSDKGQRLIDSIENKIFREEKGLQDILPGNPCIYESVAAGKHREEFMQDLDKKGFFCNIERFK